MGFDEIKDSVTVSEGETVDLGEVPGNKPITTLSARAREVRDLTTYEPKYLGKSGTDYDGLDFIPTTLRATRCEFRCDEVTARCPFTGQPDFYTVTIEYVATDRFVESKSLKLLMLTFREDRLTAEALANRVLRELDGLNARWRRVSVRQASRGGITLQVVMEASCYEEAE